MQRNSKSGSGEKEQWHFKQKQTVKKSDCCAKHNIRAEPSRDKMSQIIRGYYYSLNMHENTGETK